MTDAFNWEVVETDCVISTLPVWDVLNVFSEQDLPDWYVTQIKTLANPKYKVCWLGLYVASHEPIFTGIDPTELALWFDSPHSRLPGWAFLATGYDESVAPPGTHLYNCGFAFQGTRSMDWHEKYFRLIEKDLMTFYPKLWNSKNIIWKRRHLVANPAFGVFQKPGLVGAFRPDYTAPSVDGLYAPPIQGHLALLMLLELRYQGAGMTINRIILAAFDKCQRTVSRGKSNGTL
ncbi:MAG: hypothetical protein NTW48_09030 [Chloroflexi bacterium]|nr:hypothetical protein [Chloroflexota bacterium]